MGPSQNKSPFGGQGELDHRRRYKKSILLFVPLCFVYLGILAISAHAAVSFVQACSNAGSATSENCTLTNASSGDVVAVYVGWDVTSSTLSSVTICGTTATTSTPLTTGAVGGDTEMAYGVVGSTGNCVVTSTISISAHLNMSVQEIKGVNTSTPLDNNVATDTYTGNVGTSTNAVKTGTSTTSQAGDFIFSGIYDAGGNNSTFTAGTQSLSFTIPANSTSTTNGNLNMASEYAIQSGAGALSAAFTASVGSYFHIGMMAFKAASVSTSTPSVAWTAPANNANVSSTITLTASSTDIGSSISSVAFYEGSYGTTLASSTLIGSTSTASGTLYSIPWNTALLTNGSTTLWALATDSLSNTSTASTTVNVDNPPVISNISKSTNAMTATINWTTAGDAASSQVNYGLTSAYGSSTATSTLTTSHSLTLTGLTASTTYHFQILSTDGEGNTATTTDATFTTSAGQITLIEVKGSGTSGSNPTVTFTTSTTAGETIIVFGGTGISNSSSLATPTDNKGDIYTQVFATNPYYGGLSISANYSLWYAANVPAGVTTVSSTVGSGNQASNSEIIVSHYTGLSTSPLDVSTSTVTLQSSPWASGAVTTNQANELMIGGNFCWGNGTALCEGTSTPAFTGSWVQEATTTNTQGGENDTLLYGQQIVSSIEANVSSTGIAGTGGYSAGFVATFKGISTSTPTISSFSASPSIVASAGTSTLSWNVTNASSIAITPGSFSTSTLIGSTTVNPTSTTIYTITATNANGTSTASTTVNVQITPCYVVTPSGSGSQTGADWNNAYAGLPSTLVRGDIYYLADGTYSPYTFNTAASGTSTIEVRKAQTYDHCTGTGWNASTMGASQAVFPWTNANGIINFSNTSYITINGNSNDPAGTIGCGGAYANPPANMLAAPPNPADCGIKIDSSICTSTSTDGCDNSGEMNGGGNDITWESVEWKGAGLDSSGNNNEEAYFWFAQSPLANVIITHSYLHNAATTYFTVVNGGWTNGSFDHNYVWGLFDGSTNHGEAIQLQGSNSSDTVNNNIFRDQQTNGDMVAVTTGTQSDMSFYDNVDFCSAGGNSTSCRHNDGVIGCFNSQTCSNYLVYNNTFNFPSNCGWNVSGGSSTMTVENNLWYNCGSVGMVGGINTVDYNSYLNSNQSVVGSHDISDNSAPNPFVNLSSSTPNYNLISDNADWINRLALGAPYNIDVNGNTFTTDRGAYQYITSTHTISSFSASPSIVASAGTSTLSWNVTNATSLSISPIIGTVTGSSTTTPALSTTTIFTLTATNAYGTSTTQVTITVDGTPPSVPTSVIATTISQSEIDLSWASSTDNVGVAGYNIYQDNTFLASTTNTSYANTGLSASTLYSYYLSAYDAAGNVSATSTSVSATTSAASSGGGGGGGSSSGGGGGGYIPPVTPSSTSSSASTSTTSLGNTSSTASLEAELASLEQELQVLITEAQKQGIVIQGIPSSSFTRNLTLGSYGPDVKALQHYLNSHGFSVNTTPGNAGSPGYETEYFGPATEHALSLFQKSVGITPASGYFGPKTRSYLAGGTTPVVTPPTPTPVASTPTISTTPTAPTPSASSALTLGSTGASVTTLQTILMKDGYLSQGVFTNGTFDPATLRAVQTFQCTQNIVCTGEYGYGFVGPKTRAALGM